MTPITKIEEVLSLKKGDRINVIAVGNDWTNKLGIEELPILTYYMFTVADIPTPEEGDLKNHILKLHLTSHEGFYDIRVKVSDLLDGNWHSGS